MTTASWKFRRTAVAIFVIGVFGVVIYWWGVSPFYHDQIAGVPSLKADADKLADTVVTPYLDLPIKPGKSVVWCSTFQLVWNEGCRYAGGDIRLKDEPPMVASLNRKAADIGDVDAASCVLVSGPLKDGVLQKVRKELDQKFRGAATPDLLNEIEPKLPPNGWLAYAYLFRELQFEHPFKRLTEPLTFGGKPTASFGLRPRTTYVAAEAHATEQVVIWDYQNKDDFIVELQPKDASERIVLAKIPPSETLEKTVKTVQSRMVNDDGKWRESLLGMRDTFVVPILNFDLRRQYRELEGKTITTPGPLQDMRIIAALQAIRFRLDERGAVLKSQGAIMAKTAQGESDGPREYIFDAPFLILLERRNAKRPYLAIWVDNPELLVPAP